MSNISKHQKFIKEIQAPLRQVKKETRKKIALFDDAEDDDDETFDIELQKELENKFDELFGPLVEDD